MAFWDCKIGNKECTLKVLRTNAEKEQGYQHYPVGPSDGEGFLFLFSDQTPSRKFHMRNVKFNLDLLGFDNGGKLICVIPMESNSQEEYTIPRGCKFIVEVKEGWSKDLQPAEDDKEIYLTLR
jgi:uncharacterized membrane protein (UPF0127 family)